MNLKEMEKALKAPFHPSEIEWRIGSTTKDKKRGMALAYVTNRAIQNRLDEVFGIGGWRNEFKEWRAKGVLCGISCRFTNTLPGMVEWVTKWDGADETNFEATKGGFSDSMKRAAVEWGIGRYLYGLDAVWVNIDEYGKIVGLPPNLPEWALPEGFSYGINPAGGNPNQPKGEDKKLSNDDLGIFQNFQKELKETDVKYFNRLTASVAGLAAKYKFQPFQVKTLHDLAKLEQLHRDELGIAIRHRLDQIADMTKEEGQQPPANTDEVKCKCKKTLSAGEIKFCKDNNIFPATCYKCRQQQKAG